MLSSHPCSPIRVVVVIAFFATSCSGQDENAPGNDPADSDLPDNLVQDGESNDPIVDVSTNDGSQNPVDDANDGLDLAAAETSTTDPDLSADPADVVGTVPLYGFGVISGDCGFLGSAELASPDAMLFTSRIDFADDPFNEDDDADLLTAGGLEILRDDNAGGSSLLSEVFAYEILNRCELAVLIKTETEVCYTESSSITDIVVEIDGEYVGVSVTRAFNYPPADPLPLSEALRVLNEKLDGIESSTESVCEEDAWVKQILFILAYSDEKAETMIDAYQSLPEVDLGNTIVIVTVTDGDDSFIY